MRHIIIELLASNNYGEEKKYLMVQRILINDGRLPYGFKFCKHLLLKYILGNRKYTRYNAYRFDQS